MGEPPGAIYIARLFTLDSKNPSKQSLVGEHRGKKVINLILNEDQWEEQLRAHLESFYKEAPKFRVCTVGQSFSKVGLGPN